MLYRVSLTGKHNRFSVPQLGYLGYHLCLTIFAGAVLLLPTAATLWFRWAALQADAATEGYLGRFSQLRTTDSDRYRGEVGTINSHQLIFVFVLLRALALRFGQPESNCDFVFGFHRLSVKKSWRISPLANGIHGRRGKRLRTRDESHVRHSTFGAKNDVHFDWTFDALSLRILWIDGVYLHDQFIFLNALRSLRFFALGLNWCS